MRKVAALMLLLTATAWLSAPSALAADPVKSTQPTAATASPPASATSANAQGRPAEPINDPVLQAALVQHQQRLRELDAKLRQVHDEIRAEREKVSRVHDQIRNQREKDLAKR